MNYQEIADKANEYFDYPDAGPLILAEDVENLLENGDNLYLDDHEVEYIRSIAENLS